MRPGSLCGISRPNIRTWSGLPPGRLRRPRVRLYAHPMGINRRRLERELARAREEQRRKQDAARAAEIAEAVRIIEAWNARLAAGRRALFSPTISAAIISGYRWLTVYCPGCRTVND